MKVCALAPSEAVPSQPRANPKQIPCLRLAWGWLRFGLGLAEGWLRVDWGWLRVGWGWLRVKGCLGVGLGFNLTFFNYKSL